MIQFEAHIDVVNVLVGLVCIAGAYAAGRAHRRPAAPPPPPGVIDQKALIADLRRGTPARITEAYRHVFGGQLGRLVLTHWMASCGVGARQGPGLSADDRAYFAGRHDAAVELMTTAGFDQASAVLATLNEELGDPDHDRNDHAATGIDADDV